MRKITLISLALATVLGSLASPSLAQVRGGAAGGGAAGGGSTTGGGSTHGGGGSHHEGRGDYFAIPPVKRKPVVVLISAKGGAYCSTNLRVLFDENGRRTKVRHCDDRNHIEID